MARSKLAAIALVVLAGLVLAGLGAARTGSARLTKVSVSLDWLPNPHHAGLYYAQTHGYFEQAGLDVSMKAPSDPSAPIKYVGLGKVDLAISYEPDVFFAGQQRLPVQAVASIIPVPLLSLIALPKSGITSAAALKGRKVGTTGIPSNDADFQTILKTGHLKPTDATNVHVGFNLVPPLLRHRVDAILGFRNVEAIQLEQLLNAKPIVIPVDRLGVPSYDELVLVANSKRLRSDAAYASTVRTFIRAALKGTRAAERDPAGAVAVMKKAMDYPGKFAEASVPLSLTLAKQTSGRPLGCIDLGRWQSYGRWMRTHGLLSKSVAATTVATDRYLTGC